MKTLKGIILIFAISLMVSCDYLPFQSKKQFTPLDTIVDFRSVDTPPTFKECNDFIENGDLRDCFRTTLANFFSTELASKEYTQAFTVSRDFDESITLRLRITKQGVMHFKEIQISSELNNEIPELRSILHKTINKIPKVFPAIKRGIPVETEYILPVRIKI